MFAELRHIAPRPTNPMTIPCAHLYAFYDAIEEQALDIQDHPLTGVFSSLKQGEIAGSDVATAIVDLLDGKKTFTRRICVSTDLPKGFEPVGEIDVQLDEQEINRIVTWMKKADRGYRVLLITPN